MGALETCPSSILAWRLAHIFVGKHELVEGDTPDGLIGPGRGENVVLHVKLQIVGKASDQASLRP